MKIDIELSADQLAGLTYVTNTRNAEITLANEKLPEDQRVPLFTNETYLAWAMVSACSSYLQLLNDRKQELAVEAYRKLTPEQQASVFSAMNVPPVV